MKKYKFSFLRLELVAFIFVIIITISESINSNQPQNINRVFELFTYFFIRLTILTAFVVIIFNYALKIEMFSKDGIYIPRNRKNILKWEDLYVEQKDYSFRILDSNLEIEIKSRDDNNYKHTFSINKFNEESILKLTKKYCPPDNDFFKIISLYAKKRKIKFVNKK